MFLCLLDTGFVIERRASTSRPAHEAELVNNIRIVDYLDSNNVLPSVTFIAVKLSRIHGYALEKTNLGSVVDLYAELKPLSLTW